VCAGHILGAASIALQWGGRTIIFSGDIGRYGDPLMHDPVTPSRADYLLMESTYGDRDHDTGDVETILTKIIGNTVHRGGTVIIPAFTVGRAQNLIYYLGRLKASNRLPRLLPVFLDSPMAIDATEIFEHHAADQKLSASAFKEFGRDVRYVRSGEQSKALTASPMAKVIISASGMATGGRVLHHLERYAPDPKNAILFAGFQAGGTRGAAMVAGAETIKMHGRYVPVKAEVHNLSMLSAHADRGELLRWACGFEKPPLTTFVVHGEPGGADALRHALEEKYHWPCMVPDHAQTVELA
jgi:metallo-beta-lactamase family protein